MAQHDYVIANQTAPSFRSDLNNALNAIVTTNSGSTAPSTTYANQLWYETDTEKLWIRNAANTGWIELFFIDQSAGYARPYELANQAEAEAGTNTYKYMTPQRVAQAISALVVQEDQGWQGYDGGTGVIWQNATAITQAAPLLTNVGEAFTDGWDYAIALEDIKISQPSLFNVYIQFQFYGATTATYFNTFTSQTVMLSSSAPKDYWLEFVTPPRRTLRLHGITFVEEGGMRNYAAATTTAQKLGRLRIRPSNSTASISSGTISLLKRRNSWT